MKCDHSLKVQLALNRGIFYDATGVETTGVSPVAVAILHSIVSGPVIQGKRLPL